MAFVNTDSELFAIVHTKIRNKDGFDSIAIEKHGEVENYKKIKKIITLCLLTLLKLLTVTDRMFIGSALTQIQAYYGIGNTTAGLLQSAYVFTILVVSPITALLANHLSTKFLILVGMFLWCVFEIVCSCIPRNMFGLYLVMRGCMDISEATLGVLGPPIIIQLFKTPRSRRYAMLFYNLSISLGTGLGIYIATLHTILKAIPGSHGFQWAQRIPTFFAIPILVLSTCIFEPMYFECRLYTRYIKDIKYVVQNTTFIFSTCGAIGACFCLQAISYWYPTVISLTDKSNPATNPIMSNTVVLSIVMTICGACGHLFINILAGKLKKRFESAHTYVGGLFTLTSCLFLALAQCCFNAMHWFWTFEILGLFMINAYSAVCHEILLRTTPPHIRPAASGVYIVLCHLFGEGISPFIVGLISDIIKSQNPNFASSYYYQRVSLSNGMSISFFVLYIAASLFLFSCLTYQKDYERRNFIMREEYLQVKLTSKTKRQKKR